MGFCAYLRKSRADEVREKVESGYDALAHHRQTLEGLAEKMGVPIERWYCDGIKSGDSIDSRPEMQALLSDVESGRWEGVLCMEVERLTRGDMVDQGRVGRAFMESNTLIVTPFKVYDPHSEADMEYFEFGLFMSRREFKAINKRLIAGRLASVREGQFIGQCAPYGYDKARIDGMKTLVPNDDARFVVAVFEMYAEGLSSREIARRLDAMGAVPMRNSKWSYSSVENIVRNPAYIGKIRWNATEQRKFMENGRTRYKILPKEPIEVDGLHEPIVSMELWEAVGKRTEAPRVRNSYIKRNYYGRILRCAECGRPLTYSATGNAKEPMLVHLHPGEGCQTKGCRVSVLDSVFVQALQKAMEDFEVEPGKTTSRREDYERTIAEAQSAIEANFDRMERGIISEEDFVRRKGVLEGRIRDAQELLDAESSPDASRAVMFHECIEAIQDPEVSVEAKRRLIWGLVDRIEYSNRAPSGQDNIVLDVYLRGLNMDPQTRLPVHVQTPRGTKKRGLPEGRPEH